MSFVVGLERSAVANAFLAPRPISSAIAGPADPHVAAVFYNPAALGPLRGFHLYVDGGPRFHLGSIDLDAQGGRAAGKTTLNSTDFDGFVGMSWDLATDRATLGIAVYTPFDEFSSYPSASAVRYQEISQQSAVLEQAIAGAFKITNRVSIGASVNFGETWINYRYLRDAAPSGGRAYLDQAQALCGGQPCGLNNPLAAQDVRLRGYNWGIGFATGLLFRPVDPLWIGVSYTSHLFHHGTGSSVITLSDSSNARVHPAPGQTSSCNPCLGNDQISMAVPDIVQLGIRLELTPRIELETAARWVHYGLASQLYVRLQGGTLSQLAGPATSIPPEYAMDRGLQDTGMIEASARFRIGNLRLSPSFVWESSAVESSAVSAAAIDGNKFDFALTGEWKPRKHLTIGGHVGVTAYAIGTVSSRYDARAAATCADSGYNLADCQKVISGQALPSASGNYQPVTLHLGASVGLDF